MIADWRPVCPQLYRAKVGRELSVDEIKRRMVSLERRRQRPGLRLIDMGNRRGRGFIQVWSDPHASDNLV